MLSVDAFHESVRPVCVELLVANPVGAVGGVVSPGGGGGGEAPPTGEDMSELSCAELTAAP